MSKKKKLLYEVRNVSKDYPTPAGPLHVLKGANLEVYEGDLIFIVGRSGCGKSTLLHLIGGMDQPSRGTLHFDGEDLWRANERRRTKLRADKMGFVFQFYHLLPELTVYENVLLPTLITGRKNDAWTEEILKRTELFNRRFHFPSELSGGEQQRAALARALVNKPELVLCDEPTGNLDPETAEKVFKLILELNDKDGHTFVIVTHDERLAAKYGKTFRLIDGELRPD